MNKVIESLIICFSYLALLTIAQKLSGVKYKDLLKNANSTLKGLLIPLLISSSVLVIISIIFGWLPEVFVFDSKIHQPILWLIPLFYLVIIISRLIHGQWKVFGKKAIIYLFISTLLVGFTEELVVRGILVNSFYDKWPSYILVGIATSLIFGLMHSVNSINGQDIKITMLQVLTTSLMGFNFYIAYIISGSLWLPIALHALTDFSLMSQGKKLNQINLEPTKLEQTISLSLLITPLVSLFFL